MLSSRPFEVADTVSDESEVNPPEYESVIVDIVDIAEPTSVTIARTHPQFDRASRDEAADRKAGCCSHHHTYTGTLIHCDM